MNPLLDKYIDYLKLKDCELEYVLDNGQTINVPYSEDAFLHLIGLHKLTDIRIIQFWRDINNRTVSRRDVIRRIRNEVLTDAVVRNSIHFPLIEDRYNNFNYDKLTMLNYTDAIIDFNASQNSSLLKGSFILFEERPHNEYNHMSIAFDSINNKWYIESFFHEKTSNYLLNQTIVKIVKYTIRDSNGNVIFSDSF